jgi:hypothetical protein
MHIEAVLGDVPADQRCKCGEAKQSPTTTAPPTTWLKRLLGGK